MNMKTKIYRGIFLLAICTAGVSCSDWFDVMPRTSTYESDLYSTEGGYQRQIIGLYEKMTESGLYGANASFGMVDVVSGIYDLSATTNNTLKYALRYEYGYSSTRGVLSTIWNNGYNVIANANELLRNSGIVQDVDKERTANYKESDVFASDQTRDILTGEALAVRAYMHFDLLRMFAPSPAAGADKPAIPYVTVLQKQITPQSTVRETLDKIVTDLKQAERLLEKTDPVVAANPEPTDDTWYRRAYRPTQMNYYAVCGLLARVYLYAGNTEQAEVYAQKVIDAAEFDWTLPDNFNKGDILGVKELVFNLFTKTMKSDITDNYFSAGSVNTADMYGLSSAQYSERYASRADRRGKETVIALQNGKRIPQKYVVKEDETADTLKLKNRIPMIRLSEMYYIKAESQMNDGLLADASETLNLVREKRGALADAVYADEPAFYAELFEEYRREFLAEGQLFYYIKRRNQVGLIETQFMVDFIFPLPENEITYGLSVQTNEKYR